MIKQIFNWTLLLICPLLVMAQTPSKTSLLGKITYVSTDGAYMDLGRKAGVQAGDSVVVLHNKDVLGSAVVIQTSGTSASLKPMVVDALPWQIGDGVQVFITLPPEPTPLSDQVQDTTVTPSKPATVFLDSAVFTPFKSTRTKAQEQGYRQRFSGYLSARADTRGGNGASGTSNNLALYGQFRVRDLGLEHLDASLYLRGSESSSASSSGMQVYSVMLEYANPASPMRLYLGRMYHPQFSMLGTVDGMGVGWLGKHRSLALLAGSETPIPGAPAAATQQKFGFIEEENFSWGNLQFGSVSQFSTAGLARTYLILGSTFRPHRALRVHSYAELDLDPQDNSVNQDAVSVTNFRTALNWRFLKNFSSNLRYSYRENVVDLLDTASTEFDLASRHAVNLGGSWLISPYMSLSTQASLRTDGSGRDIQVYGLTFNHRSLGRRELKLNSGAMAMLSYVTRGGRLYASLGYTVSPRFDLDIYDEVYIYKILGDDVIRVRHLPELSVSAKIKGLSRLRLRTRLEQEGGELFYRISLGASRQF